MAKNVTITWALPAARQGGAALTPAELDYTLVEISADAGTNWTELARVAPTDPQQVFLPNLEVGGWQVRIRVMDLLGQLGAPHVELFDVIDDSPAGPVTNVLVTQE